MGEVNFMKTKEILDGLKYRLDSLKELEKVLSKEKTTAFLLTDTEARVDELTSIFNWIKENSEE